MPDMPQDFLSPVTPPFVPQGDPYAGLDSILNNLSTQQYPVNQPSKLDMIMNALAQAAAVGASPDPGGTLMQQLKMRQDQKNQELNYQRQQQNQLNTIKLQVGMQKAENLAREQQDFAKEQRARIAKKEDQQFAIQQFNREMTGKEKLDNINFEQQKAIVNLKQYYDQQNDETRNKFVADVNKQKDLNDRSKQSLIQTVDLIQSGMEAGTARSIVKKFMNDEELTPEESKALTASAIRSKALALKAARSGSGSGGYGLSEKQAFQLLFDAAKTPMAVVTGPDGKDTVMEVTAIPKDFMGNLVGVKRYLSANESAAYATQTTLPAVMGALRGGGSAGKAQPVPPPPPAQTGGIERLMGIMTDAKSKGRTSEQLKIILEKNGASADQINFLMGGVQGPIVSPSMLAPKVTTQPVQKLPGMHEMN